ncbi:MAG: adenylate/guanylate cyclase domain-containing protein [Betaproteobacteria bacterium]
MSTLTALQHDRNRLYLRIVAVSATVGLLYGAFLSRQGLAVWTSMGMGVLNGAGIAGCIGAIEIYVLREGSTMKRLLRLPFLAVVLLKTAAYAAIVSLFIVGLPWAFGAAPLERHAGLVAIGFSMAMTLIVVVTLQAAGLVGRRTFRNLVLGRYRRPRAERRFFLFVDVVGSTAIAERLGAMQAHLFLASVFSATAEAIAAARGEIYQYVGDEIVVTWTEEEGLPSARPLRCLADMRAALAAAAPEFRARFGAEPELRAALHLGEVIAGEVGEQRRAIVYHGDVMNTASRLEQATRDAGVRFIVSDAALSALGRPADYACRDLGELELRGRREAIRAWAVETAL